MYRPNLKSVALPVPEIIGVACSRKISGVGNGTVRKSVGEFLLAIHIDYFSITTRLPEFFDWSFGQGNEPPILRKRMP